MTYTYSLGAKVISEFVAMTLTIFMGESILANELLPSTKGHGMGILAVSIGFGLAFGVNIAWFGFISAHINPAMFFFLALIGKVEWKEFAACACADFAGAFLGAVLVAIFYLPHFGFSLPLPSNISDTANVMDGMVTLEKDAGRIASAFGPASHQPRGLTLRQEIQNFSFFNLPTDEDFLDTSCCTEEESAQRQTLLEKMKMRYKRRVATTHAAHNHCGATTPVNHQQYFVTSNESVNVATLLHANDKSLPVSATDGSVSTLRHSVQVAGLLHTHDEQQQQSVKSEGAKGVTNNSGIITELTNDTTSGNEVAAMSKEKPVEQEDIEAQQQQDNKQQQQEEEEAALAAYKAALQADASAKLSIFATRPAIWNRPYNFLQEAILTAALVLGAELFNLRKEFQVELTGVPFVEGPWMQSFYVAFFIAMLILSLGGVTGLAANPARDLGPRMAHWLLPLPGKGSSEWEYGLVVPLWGPFTGAAIGAAIFKGCEALFEMAEVVEEVAGGEL